MKPTNVDPQPVMKDSVNMADKKQIREMSALGMSVDEISLRLLVNKSVISSWVKYLDKDIKARKADLKASTVKEISPTEINKLELVIDDLRKANKLLNKTNDEKLERGVKKAVDVANDESDKVVANLESELATMTAIKEQVEADLAQLKADVEQAEADEAKAKAEEK